MADTHPLPHHLGETLPTAVKVLSILGEVSEAAAATADGEIRTPDFTSSHRTALGFHPGFGK